MGLLQLSTRSPKPFSSHGVLDQGFSLPLRSRPWSLNDLSLQICRRSDPTRMYSLSFTTPPPSSISSPPAPIKSSSPYQNPKTPFFQSMVIPAAVAVAASALVFARSRNSPIIAAPIISHEEEEQEISIRDLKKPKDPNHHLLQQSLEYYKLKEGSISLRFVELESNDSDLPLLLARIRSSSQGLLTTRTGFQDVLEKDPDGVKAHMEIVDELIGVLKDMEEAVDMYLKEQRKLDLRHLNTVLVRIRVLEWRFLEILKDIQEGIGYRVLN